jgi:enterochelin esterase family protein
VDIETYQRLGLDRPYPLDEMPRVVNGDTLGEIVNQTALPEDAQYHPCDEASPRDSTPRGSVERVESFASRVFPGTSRAISIYVPQQLDPGGQPPALIVFNDGDLYLPDDGPVRPTTVLDTLIHRGEIPVTVGVFVNPDGRHRSAEYDPLTDRYTTFLLDEVLPMAEERVGARFTHDSKHRIMCGISSGGICAFTVAWQRPDLFGVVLSHCGSFVNIRGGHNYPYLVRTTERKPIRVFLQDGESDLDCLLGNWPLANREMASALAYAGYDFKFVMGDGSHNLRHGGAIFADSLRWLFRPWEDAT